MKVGIHIWGEKKREEETERKEVRDREKRSKRQTKRDKEFKTLDFNPKTFVQK